MKSGFPEAMEDSKAELYSFSADDSERLWWFEQKVVKKEKELKVVNTVSWYHGEIEANNIARIIPKIKWADRYQWLIRRSKGGRPRISREVTLYPEAIVCALLKKQGLTYKEIASQFGWRLQSDSYGNQSISNTALNRVKLGRVIMKRYYRE